MDGVTTLIEQSLVSCLLAKVGLKVHPFSIAISGTPLLVCLADVIYLSMCQSVRASSIIMIYISPLSSHRFKSQIKPRWKQL